MKRRSKSKRVDRPASRKLRLESLEHRRLLAAAPMGATLQDTGEFLLGSVAVTPVLFESNGATDQESQDWVSAEIDAAIAKVVEGVTWWSDTLDALNTVHTVDFVFDNQFALEPFETSYEPIDRISNDFNLYVGEFLVAEGFGNVSSIEEGMKLFNSQQREQLGTDWAFTVFIVDSSDDPDGQFLPGGYFQTAFAYAGGLFVVSSSSRPASTIAHEMGHIFWAKDEYPGGASWTDRRGYYNAQNLNAADNTTSGFVQEDSIMRGGIALGNAYSANQSPESTLAMIGWRDTDNDGIFDIADVPLELIGEGYFDATSSTYYFTGSASAVPLLNQNSSGPQSDITLNRVSQLQYRLDAGEWVTAAQPDEQQANFDLAITLGQPFLSIQWRVVDDVTGVTSAVIDGDSHLPAYSATRGSGIVFLDENQNQQRDSSEDVLVNTTVSIKNSDGSDLVFGEIKAENYESGFLNSGVPNVALTSSNSSSFKVVYVGELSVGGVRVFQQYDINTLNSSLTSHWTEEQPLTATFDSPVGSVAFDIHGSSEGSYARIEAYDALGNLLHRATSDLIVAGSTETVTMNDPEGRIVSVRVFGHADTEVIVRGINFGTDPLVLVGESGGWRFDHLPSGQYTVNLTPELLIHQFDQASFTLHVSTTGSSFVQTAASRVDSPHFNAAMPSDVNGSGTLSALDALKLINDLALNGERDLQLGELIEDFIDVTNDGRASLLDVLRVINDLVISSGEGEAEAGALMGLADPIDSLQGTRADDNSVDSGISYQKLPGCTASTAQNSSVGGVLNYADSHKRSESIGMASADTLYYGPIYKAVSPVISVFFSIDTTEDIVEENGDLMGGAMSVLQKRPVKGLQLSE